MIISQIIKFEGSLDDLIWKSPVENFNTTSQLIVDETHEALLVVNGNACDLFGAGRHTLETTNIPLVKGITNIPTDGVSSFFCKLFFINKVHQMDMTWGIPGEITLDDPKYDIFLHIGLCGNMNFAVKDSRKFILKAVGFREQFDGADLVTKFRGIIKQHVKSYVSKIMIKGKVSYFDMNENLFEISNVVKEQLAGIFDDYGIEILVFNIETITVPDEDYQAVKKAKENRATRIIEGYTWQEEKQIEVVKEFAGNDGTMGNIGSAVGGFMIGGAFGGTIGDIARNALGNENITSKVPPKDLSDVKIQNLNVNKNEAAKFCTSCGNSLTSDMMFCPKCGTKQGKVCPGCNTPLMPDAMFCHKCGTKC